MQCAAAPAVLHSLAHWHCRAALRRGGACHLLGRFSLKQSGYAGRTAEPLVQHPSFFTSQGV
jgi:hypothetical protein